MYEMMGTAPSKDLPYDIVVDIFSRLGVKTLMRLRCVCKSWNATITHHTFITKHLNHVCSYNNNNNGYLQYLSIPSYSTKLSWYLLCEQTHVQQAKLEIPSNHPTVLIGTLNGLLCLSDLGRNICLWNPSIRKSKTIPSSSLTLLLPQHFHSKNYVVVGFGFDSQTNDYKIVRIIYCKDVNLGHIANSPPLPPPVEVYSLRTDSWRRIEALVPCYGSPHRYSAAFFNGRVHWVASISVAHPDHNYTIMSFDIGGEVFGEMTLPNYNIDGVVPVVLNLAVLKESLSLCACFRESGQCDIWVMREYGVVESWTKQFTIVLPRERIQRFLGFTNNVVFLNMGSGKVVCYDLEILQCKNLGIREAICTSNVFPFMETLVLL